MNLTRILGAALGSAAIAAYAQQANMPPEFDQKYERVVESRRETYQDGSMDLQSAVRLFGRLQIAYDAAKKLPAEKRSNALARITQDFAMMAGDIEEYRKSKHGEDHDALAQMLYSRVNNLRHMMLIEDIQTNVSSRAAPSIEQESFADMYARDFGALQAAVYEKDSNIARSKAISCLRWLSTDDNLFQQQYAIFNHFMSQDAAQKVLFTHKGYEQGEDINAQFDQIVDKKRELEQRVTK